MSLCTSVNLCYLANIDAPLEDVGLFFYSVTVDGFLAEVKALDSLDWQVMNLLYVSSFSRSELQNLPQFIVSTMRVSASGSRVTCKG